VLIARRIGERSTNPEPVANRIFACSFDPATL